MRNRRKFAGGFSLVEMMIAVFVGALLIMISYHVLTTQKKAADAQNQYIGAQQNARIALETLEKELRLAGLNIDDFNGQPIFIDAAPYQVIINADISGGVMGVPGMTIYQSVPLHDGTYYVPGMLPGENIAALGRYNNNAETIRYSLDRDDNGIVNASDAYDESRNPDDYAIYREENGTKKDIIAYGIRGRENYPDGEIPEPVFKYYGDFNDDGNIILWGDNNGDGSLNQAEIAAITAVPQNLLTKIVEVEIVIEAESPMMEAGYAGRHSTSGHPRAYRSVTMSSKVRPRNVGTGSANLHACGLPPASPTSLSAVDTPKDEGESITLDFNSSYDELNGEEDVFNYAVYRREGGGGDWVCIGAITPTGVNSYVWYDDKHALLGGPEPGIDYYYVVTAWDCRPQESGPSNVAGPVMAVANGPEPPNITEAFDTPCDEEAEVTVVLHHSPDDQGTGLVSKYEIYRGVEAGGGRGSKELIGKISATGSEYYVFLDNEANNLGLNPPEAGNYYYYLARAIGGAPDSIPSTDSNEYGAVYYSGTISACQLVTVEDYPDDEGEVLRITWRKSPSEDCGAGTVMEYWIKRKSIYEDYEVVVAVAAVNSPYYTHVDDGLVRGNEYTYCIWTIGSGDGEEVPSNEMSGIPLRNTELDPPVNLAAEDILCDATGAVDVTWEHSPQDIPSSEAVTRYLIYRRQDFSVSLKVGEMEATGSETYLYVDGPESNPTNPPIIGETYYYSATAYNEEHAKESAPSNESSTMSDGEPGAPRLTQVFDTPVDAGQSITVVFDRSADDGHCSNNVIIYKILRDTEEDGSFSHVVGEVTATGSMSYTYYDDDLFSYDPPVDGIGYYYAVRAVESDGKESINSNILGPVYSISQDPSSYIVFEDDFESDEGWVHGYTRSQDDWQRGTPMGKGGYYGNDDPDYAHSGSNVFGNDLGTGYWNGLYRNNMSNYLMTPEGEVDCAGHSNVVLQFHRWLNVEGPAYDQAEIFISTNGHNGPWTRIWRNESEITDYEWVFMEIDISQWADGESNVAIMWKLTSDGYHDYTGWNIDDVVVRRAPSAP